MKKFFKKALCLLLSLVTLTAMIPTSILHIHAGHKCPGCDDWIDGSPYCSECYQCDACIDLCIECGVCTECSGSEICDGCSEEEIGSNMCLECAFEKGTHCPSCEACYFGVGLWCEECGVCEDCVDYDDNCSVTHGQHLCIDCAAEKGTHCPGCDTCYFETGPWCEECGLCDDCSEYDAECSQTHGASLCVECAAERGTHCPECSACYFDVGTWCEECAVCADCSPICIYCCEEAGAVICEACAIEAGMHCPECSGCYDGGEFCVECGVCTGCADICATDELCMDCAITEGYHCPSCEECSDQTVICEGCGEYCSECSGAFCENCNLCDQCVMICQGCSSCEECATICPSCEEYCSECEGICDYCELCLVCCEDIANFEGCDCGDWVCIENDDWNDHFGENHTNASGSHSSRPSPTWTWDDEYHWHGCVYCEDSAHFSNKGKHIFDAQGKCQECNYMKNAQIQIIVQPRNSKDAFVSSCEEDNDERNIAHFTTKAIGNSALTYTWCRKMYVSGVLQYVPLKYPEPMECYEGPNASILVPTDSCCNEYIYACIITDEDGNEVITTDVVINAKHDYQYFKEWRTNERPYELAERNKYGHVLECVGEGCEKVTHLRPHEDEDNDAYCDICDYEIGKILIKKQPKDDKKAYVYGPKEDYDESNFAHFSVVAEGESELTYTWCRKMYVGGVLKYVPLTYPVEGECFDGPDASILVPMDSCYNEYIYACIITDEEGNETRTVDVTLQAKHNYQYFEDYQVTRENPLFYARKKYAGHILVCVGEACDKVTRLRQHVDENLDYVCEICDHKKDMYMPIGIFVTAPQEGKLPSYNVTSDRPICYRARGNSENYGLHRFWFVSDNGVDNWKMIDKNTPFVAGKYYKLEIEMETSEGYSLTPFVSYGDSEPYIWAEVNGNSTKAFKTYGMDSSRYCTIKYEFGMCNDSVIENIVIENVTAPVAGEKPTYSATIRGSGYAIDTSKNLQLDDYWNNPQKKPHYIKNGIGWFDMTEYDWVYENEYFIPGHEYRVDVYLKTEDGYTFYHDKWYEMLFTASINGFSANGNTTTSDGLYRQTISTSFQCQGKKITTVMINGLSTPKAGETPDYTVSAAYPEWYQPDPIYGGTGGVIWFDSQGNQLEPTDKFVEGEKYRVEIKVIPAKLSDADTSQFVTPLSVYINGNLVVANDEWDAVYAKSNAVNIYYTFPKGAAAPAKPPVTTKFGDSNGDGAIDTKDAVLLAQYLAKWSVTVSEAAADCNNDGIIDTKDAVLLAQYLAKWDVTLG